MRLLGTSPAPIPLPPPAPFFLFPCVSSCPPVFLGHFFVFPLPPDRPAADRSKVISPWFVLDGSTVVPALAPFSSWPRGLVRECCPAGRPWTSTSLPRTSNQRHPKGITWPFPRPRLAAVVREYGLPLVDLLDPLCLPPPMQLTSGIFSAGERIKGHESRFHSLLLEYFGV